MNIYMVYRESGTSHGEDHSCEHVAAYQNPDKAYELAEELNAKYGSAGFPWVDYYVEVFEVKG